MILGDEKTVTLEQVKKMVVMPAVGMPARAWSEASLWDWRLLGSRWTSWTVEEGGGVCEEAVRP